MKTLTIDRSRDWTVEDFQQLGESNTFCELINGELFTSPTPPVFHQIVSGNLNYMLRIEAEKNEGVVFFGPIDLYLDNRNVFSARSGLYFQSKERYYNAAGY